tara:strand:- start:297 stop:1442 length:1146 start_codon:yes stop_codon:yes gene_type:complete
MDDQRQLLSDLVYYQFLIKSNTEIDHEQNHNSIEIYNKYKTLLTEVISVLNNNKIREEEQNNIMNTYDSEVQLAKIKKDIQLMAKSKLLHMAYNSTGIRSIAKTYVKLQNQIDNDTEDTLEKDMDSNDEVNDTDIDSDSASVILEDETENIDLLQNKMKEDFNEYFNSDNENVISDDTTDEEISSREDKIIPIKGKISETFLETNDIDKEVTTSLNNTDNIVVEEPIEYFNKTREWGWLSTFHIGNSFMYLHRQYVSVEHAFNAQKSFDTVYQNLFVQEESTYIGDDPMEAKIKGGKKSFSSSLFAMRTDWDDVRVQIMEECMIAFYNANPILKEKLLATYPKPLHHTGYKIGTFWGMQQGKGVNTHGKILMSLREKWRTE